MYSNCKTTNYLLLLRNGVPVRSDGHRIHASQDGSLFLNNVQLGDEGSYTCNAYSGNNSVSASTDVKVIKRQPEGGCAVVFKFILIPSIGFHSSCNLKCVACAFPSRARNVFCCRSSVETHLVDPVHEAHF